MPNYSANIQLVVQGQDRLKFVLNSVEKLNSIISRLKPINLLAAGRGAGADVINQTKKQLDDFSRAIVNFKPEGIQKRAKELSNTLAGSAAQADALTIALENVGLKAGGFSKQAAEVKNYALALEQTRRNAERLGAISQQVQRGARIQTIAERFNVSPLTIEQRLNNLRNIRYTKDREAEAARFMALKREEDFELRLQRIRERNAAAQEKQAVQRERLSNVALGAGFPLLFGGGPGAVIGGGLGGLVGGPGAFAAQIGLSAIGQQLDQTRQVAGEFAKALREGGDAVAFLDANVGTLDPRTRTLLTNLQQSGQTAAAASIAFKQLSDAIGRENALALKEAGDQTNAYTKGLDRLRLAFVATGLRANEFFNNLKRNPLGTEKPFTEKALERFFPSAQKTPQASITPEATQRIQALRRETTILQTQATLGTLSAKNSLEQFIYVSQRVIQQERLKEQAEIEYKFKQGQITLTEKLLMLEQTRLNAQVGLNNLERQRLEEIKRRQEEAARAAEEAQRAAEAALRARVEAVSSLYEEEKRYYDLVVQGKELLVGPGAAVTEQLKNLNEVKFRDYEILRLEKEQALVEAQKTGTVAQVNALYDRRLENLNQQYAVQEEQLKLEYNRIRLEQQLAAQNRREGIQSAVDPIRQQQNQIELDVRAFTTPAAVIAQEELALKQRTRLYNEELPILREINTLNMEISSLAFSEEASAAKQLDLAAQQQKLSAIREELGLLDQLEQKQLKLQQFFAQYGQLIQTVSGEIANVVTTGVAEMVKGTKTAQQVFSEFLNAIANALLQTAQQMIATYIAIGIAKMFAGLNSSNSGGNVLDTSGFKQYPLLEGPSFTPYASGGYVATPTTALIGEGGEPEYVIPASKMRGAMSRYASGARGSSVIPAGSDGGEMGGTATMAPAAIDVRYTVERINSVDYVTADQFRQGMQQAAAQGAARGEQATIRRLQQSRSTRSRLGIS